MSQIGCTSCCDECDELGAVIGPAGPDGNSGSNGTDGTDGIVVVDTQTSLNSTAANTTLTTLKTITVPANTVSTNGSKLYITAVFNLAVNGNTKNISLGIPSTTITYTTTGSGLYTMTAELARITSTTYQYVVWVSTPATSLVQAFSNSAATDFTTGINLTTIGQNGTASAGDINNYLFTVDSGIK